MIWNWKRKREAAQLAHRKTQAYVQVNSGERVYPYALTEDQIHIEDIAHSLSLQCRFNGHTDSFISVAEHSIRVADIVSAEYKLTALLHDSPEYILGDFVAPVKQFFPDYKELEETIAEVIQRKYQTKPFDAPEIKLADMVMRNKEAHENFSCDVSMWAGRPPVTKLEKVIMPSKYAKDEFLRRFYQYTT